MKLDLVPFEIAVKLKEKGFQELCHSYYFEDGEFIENSIKDVIGMDYGSEIE